MNRLSIYCLLLSSGVLLNAQTSFIRSYSAPLETIYNVRTVRAVLTPEGERYLLALEGYSHVNNAFFTRLQSTMADGELSPDFGSAFVGNPLTLSSGVFDLSDSWSSKVLTPAIKDTLNPSRHRLIMHEGYADDNDIRYYGLLPDSMQTSLEFPSVASSRIDRVWGERIYIAGGRALCNGYSRCFAFKEWAFATFYPPPDLLVNFPGLEHISGLCVATWLESGDTYPRKGYLAVGQAGNWTGCIMLVDDANQLLWQQNFTDGADASQVPYFCTPLLATGIIYQPPIYNDNVIFISYQDKARRLHIARYYDRYLEERVNLQLDGYIGAAPLCITDTTFAVAYVKDGRQVLSRYGHSGVLLWSRTLPGCGNFGKQALTSVYSYSYDQLFYLVGGRMPDGNYYLAKVRAEDGQVESDTVTPPELFSCRAYPNPFANELKLAFELPHPAAVTFSLYNLKGQHIYTSAPESFPAGKYLRFWNTETLLPRHLASGVYLLKITAGPQTRVLRLVHLKD